MNVIIANKHVEALQNLEIDIIKSEQGVFTVEELVTKYQNFFYQRMILDITALKDYKDIKTLQKLSISLDMDKLILLLDDGDADTSAADFLSQLISIGIYNFTKNIEGIMYLYNHPNTYRDVAQYHQIEEEFTSSEVAQVQEYDESKGVRIIGVKDVTRGAGATTLVYMMKKMLEKNYKVVAIEVDKSDFVFFRDKDLISATSSNVGGIIAKNSDKDVILIDLNNSAAAMNAVHDVIYLVEPSIIRINRMMMVEPDILNTLKGKHVILNKSLLTSKDMLDFEYESKLKIFFNLPPLDDREKDIRILNTMLAKMGFKKQNPTEEVKKRKGLFGF